MHDGLKRLRAEARYGLREAKDHGALAAVASLERIVKDEALDLCFGDDEET
jgi:hypothetical protein